MIVPSQLALKTHTNLGCAATLDKLVSYDQKVFGSRYQWNVKTIYRIIYFFCP
jgi:hypothetical protein